MRNFFGKTAGGHHPDYFLGAVIFLLTAAGLTALASASSDLAEFRFNDSYYYLLHQVLYGLSFGVIGFLVGSKLYYQNYKKIALFLLILNLLLLLLIFTPLGVTAGGASRWLSLGPMTFQPSEFLKLSFVLYLAAWLANTKKKRTHEVRAGLVPFLLIASLMAGLLLLQPATSMVVILLGAAVAIYFASGAKIRYILFLGGAAIMGLALIVLVTPYRLERITSFLNPGSDPQGADYHRDQSLIALGSGGLFGIGYGEGAAKLNYLPAVVDDSIFAVVGQELGFVGAGALLTLFALLVFRLFWLARRTSDRFGQLVLIGFGTIFALQSFINIGAISGLIPLTGVPLPFVSFGGTALAISLTMGGIAMNISRFT